MLMEDCRDFTTAVLGVLDAWGTAGHVVLLALLVGFVALGAAPRRPWP